MNTASVVQEVNRLNPDWTPAQILDVLNNIVKFLIKRELDQNIYIDPATGNLPYISTTSGTYSYHPSITGVTFWKIRAIVTDLGDDPDFDVTLNDWNREYISVKFRNRSYNTFPVQLKDESETGTTPQIIFLDDPGTQTQKYRIMAYQSPPEIISLAVNIPIADRYRNTVIIPSVQTMLDALDNGRYQDGIAYVQSVSQQLLYADKDMGRIYSMNYQW